VCVYTATTSDDTRQIVSAYRPINMTHSNVFINFLDRISFCRRPVKLLLGNHTATGLDELIKHPIANAADVDDGHRDTINTRR
jgi:hypothetical protein